MIGLLDELGAAQGIVSVLAFFLLLLTAAATGLLILRRARRPAFVALVLTTLTVGAALALTL